MCYYQPNKPPCTCTFHQLIQPCKRSKRLPSLNPTENPNPLVVVCGRKRFCRGVGVRVCRSCGGGGGGGGRVVHPHSQPPVLPSITSSFCPVGAGVDGQGQGQGQRENGQNAGQYTMLAASFGGMRKRSVSVGIASSSSRRTHRRCVLDLGARSHFRSIRGVESGSRSGSQRQRPLAPRSVPVDYCEGTVGSSSSYMTISSTSSPGCPVGSQAVAGEKDWREDKKQGEMGLEELVQREGHRTAIYELDGNTKVMPEK